MIALIGLITSLAGGAALGPLLAGLSVAQWTSILGVVLPAGEQAVQALVALHPTFQQLAGELLAAAKSDGSLQNLQVGVLAQRTAALEWSAEDADGDFDRRNTSA